MKRKSDDDKKIRMKIEVVCTVEGPKRHIRNLARDINQARSFMHIMEAFQFNWLLFPPQTHWAGDDRCHVADWLHGHLKARKRLTGNPEKVTCKLCLKKLSKEKKP